MKTVMIDEKFKKTIESRRWEIEDRIQDFVYRGLADTRKDLYSPLNKMVYDLAEKNGLTVWDVCFRYVPEFSFETDPEKPFSFRETVTLVPIHEPWMDELWEQSGQE